MPVVLYDLGASGALMQTVYVLSDDRIEPLPFLQFGQSIMSPIGFRAAQQRVHLQQHSPHLGGIAAKRFDMAKLHGIKS